MTEYLRAIAYLCIGFPSLISGGGLIALLGPELGFGAWTGPIWGIMLALALFGMYCVVIAIGYLTNPETTREAIEGM